jgi:hypothetical protein
LRVFAFVASTGAPAVARTAAASVVAALVAVEFEPAVAAVAVESASVAAVAAVLLLLLLVLLLYLFIHENHFRCEKKVRECTPLKHKLRTPAERAHPH